MKEKLTSSYSQKLAKNIRTHTHTHTDKLTRSWKSTSPIAFHRHLLRPKIWEGEQSSLRVINPRQPSFISFCVAVFLHYPIEIVWPNKRILHLLPSSFIAILAHHHRVVVVMCHKNYGVFLSALPFVYIWWLRSCEVNRSAMRKTEKGNGKHFHLWLGNSTSH